MRFSLSILAALAATLAVQSGTAAAAPIKIAAFDFEFYDTSAEGEINGPRADEAELIKHVTAQVRDFLKTRDMEVVDVAPAQKDIEAQSLRTCGPCSAKMAASLGADYSLMGYVQKVSNLILNLNVEIRDARTGDIVRRGSADIRGNTEESWKHGASYLMRNTILKTSLGNEAKPQ